MRKNVIFAVIASIASLASCQKEEVMPGQDSQSEELVFTATIDQNSTKTTINTNISDSENGGKIYWVKDDEITITDKDSKSAVYVAQSGGSTTTTFKIKSGEAALGKGPYSATYKAAPATAQAYADYYSAANTAKDLYMTASSTSGTTLTFTAACGLLKLNLASSSENNKEVCKIEIVGTPTNGSATVYTLNCNNESIESAKDFYIALPAGSYTLMKFTNSKGCVCFKKAKSAIEIKDNKIQPVTLSGITFSALLPGKFTVGASGKQVQFSTANLYWDSSAYAFESSQTAYPTSWDENHVGHFYWSKTASVAYAKTYSDSGASTDDKFFCGESSSPLTVEGTGELFALSKSEWTYLLSSTGRGDGASKFKFPVTVNGNDNCLVIAPDGYSGTIASSYDAAAWATAESTGLVCLPAAGYRNGLTMSDVGSCGWYWSATQSVGGKNSAFFLGFLKNGVQPSVSEKRSNGGSVRLVKVCTVPTYTEGSYSEKGIKVAGIWWAPVNCGYEPVNGDYKGYPYGKLYQWGRKDGQGYDSSDATYPSGANLVNSQVSDLTTLGSDIFYYGYGNWYNGASPSADALWGATKTSYDPCPTGWRVPTSAELTALLGSAKGERTISDGIHGSSTCRGLYYDGTTGTNPTSGVFLPTAGCRSSSTGSAIDRGSYGYYRSSSASSILYSGSSSAYMGNFSRACGYSVRCVQE